MPEPEPELEQLAEFTDNLIIIRWDEQEGHVVYDLGELDGWSAVTILQKVFDAVYDSLPDPVNAEDDD